MTRKEVDDDTFHSELANNNGIWKLSEEALQKVYEAQVIMDKMRIDHKDSCDREPWKKIYYALEIAELQLEIMRRCAMMLEANIYKGTYYFKGDFNDSNC